MIWWLVHNTLSAAILALVAMLVCRWRRAHPALRHALWLVVLAKLVAPPLPVWSFAWPASWSDPWTLAAQAWGKSETAAAGATESEQLVAPVAAEASTFAVDRMPGDPESFVLLGAAGNVPTASDVKPMSAIPGAASGDFVPHSWTNYLTWSDWNGLVLRVWLAAGAVMLAYQLYRWRRFQNLLDSTVAAPEWLENEVRAIASELKIDAPEVNVLGVRCTPLVWVLGRVQLLWPESMLEGFSAESRRTIIAHELAHLARRDHWVARCEVAAAVCWWWHPLFWYVRAMLHDAAEQACDARVTQLLPSARRAYAQALVEVCELLAQAVTPGPALGIGSQTRRAFERRLTMIMREKVASRLSLGAVTGVGLLALVVLPGFTPAQDNPPVPGATTAVAVDELFVAKAPPATTGAPTALPEPIAPPIPGVPSAPAALPPVGPPISASGSAFTYGTPPSPIPAGPGGLTPPTATPHMGRMPSGYDQTPADFSETGADEVVMLTRAKYRLPGPLAESFANYLNSTLGDAVLAKVEGNQSNPYAPQNGVDASRIIVTTDEETQRIVGQFIGLLRTRGKLQDGMGMGMMSAGMTGAGDYLGMPDGMPAMDSNVPPFEATTGSGGPPVGWRTNGALGVEFAAPDAGPGGAPPLPTDGEAPRTERVRN